MQQLAHAISYAAWWLDGQIGRSDHVEVIAYLGVSDIRYPILLFAAIKCGYQFANTSSAELRIWQLVSPQGAQ